MGMERALARVARSTSTRLFTDNTLVIWNEAVARRNCREIVSAPGERIFRDSGGTGLLKVINNERADNLHARRRTNGNFGNSVEDDTIKDWII